MAFVTSVQHIGKLFTKATKGKQKEVQLLCLFGLQFQMLVE